MDEARTAANEVVREATEESGLGSHRTGNHAPRLTQSQLKIGALEGELDDIALAQGGDEFSQIGNA